jgi:hypothetical protein
MELSPENRQWYEAFVADYGRPPRILHIGNIANNAYNNAKLLNAAGTENDVICYDYYHSMGCPEWEDADFSGTIKDDFHPDWHALDIKGFKRPTWFVQGAQRDCLEYLLAVRTGRTTVAEDLWQRLSQSNRTVAPPAPVSKWKTWHHATASKLMERLARLYHWTQIDPAQAFPRVLGYLRAYMPGWRMLVAPLLTAGWKVVAASTSGVVRMGRQIGVLAYARPHVGDAGLFSSRQAELVAGWSQQFPERVDGLQQSDLVIYQSTIEQWRWLFRHYDIVIGYSTDGIWPLLTGKPYIAFEHGTIREIPYQSTTQGRNTALTYRHAAHVFVTNFDCQASAQLLAPGRFTLINHPYDEDHGLCAEDWSLLRAQLRARLDADLLCFFPTRHDWVAGTGYADKANDTFLLALAELRRKGVRVGAVCCEWGANVAQSKTLIATEGLEPHVMWERPMAMVKFERMARACDLVVDQFKLGAFGGIVFKAMAVGAPILTYLDEQRLLDQYPEIPPVINCRTTNSIVHALDSLAREPHRLVAQGQASRAWIKRHHGKETTVNLQFDQFRKMPLPLRARVGGTTFT